MIDFRSRTSPGLAVQGIDITCALACRFRGVAFIVYDRSIDDNLVSDLDILVSHRPLAVAEVISLENVETACTILTVNNVEVGIAIAAAGLEGG